MTAPDWRVLVAVVAADWLAGDPQALDRAHILADHATNTGQVCELVAALLDSIVVAVDDAGNLQRAHRALENRALGR